MAEEKNGGDNYSEIIGDARGVGKHDAIFVGYHVFFLEILGGFFPWKTKTNECPLENQWLEDVFPL